MTSTDAKASALESLYAGLPDGGDVSPADRAAVDARAGQGAATYGELTTEGALRMIRWLRLTPSDRFIDLGSGTGRIPIIAALSSDVGYARGVELSSERHAVAESARARLAADVAPRVIFSNEDLSTTNLDAATVIFAGSLAFPDKLMTVLSRRVSALASLRALLTLKPLPPSSRLSERAHFDVATTWSPKTPIYVYE